MTKLLTSAGFINAPSSENLNGLAGLEAGRPSRMRPAVDYKALGTGH
jgi:hypothetical protein